MRLSREQLQEKIHENNCKYSLSWSKLHTYIEDPFSFYLKYLKNIPEEKNNAYAVMGDIVHKGLESFYENKKTLSEVAKEFEEELSKQSYLGITFVKDEEQNKRISDDYLNCIKHFLNNYKKASDNSKLETFVGWKFGDYYMQGYIDHMYPIDEQHIVIEDFKTSTIYQGKKIQENAGQLKLYAYMIHKMYNIPLKNIIIGWNFLKYVNVDIEQKNGKTKTSVILRKEIPEKIYSKLKVWGKSFKYSDEEIESFYNILQNNAKEYKDANIFEGIPENLASKFNIRDAFVEIPFDENTMNEFIDYVNETIDEMTRSIETYRLTQDENIFWKEITKENSFFFINLCGYTAKNHKPLKKYLDNLSGYEGSVDKKDLDNEIFNLLFADN